MDRMYVLKEKTAFFNAKFKNLRILAHYELDASVSCCA